MALEKDNVSCDTEKVVGCLVIKIYLLISIFSETTMKRKGDVNSTMKVGEEEGDSEGRKSDNKKGSGRRFKRQPRQSKEKKQEQGMLLVDGKKRGREDGEKMDVDEVRKGKCVKSGVVSVDAKLAGPADRSCEES